MIKPNFLLMMAAVSGIFPLAAHGVLVFPSPRYTLYFAESTEIDPLIRYQPRDTNLIYDCMPAGCAYPQYLFVMLPAAGATAMSYQKILSTMADLGIRAIGLNYHNNDEIFNICGTDDVCYDIARRDKVVGSNHSPYVSSVEDGIVNRLHTTLRKAGWHDLYDPVSGEVMTQRIILAGDGQGAGMAAWTGKQVALARVCQFSGTWDHVAPAAQVTPTVDNWLAASWLRQPSATLAAQMFGFAYKNDILQNGIDLLAINWNALGMGNAGQTMSLATSPRSQMVKADELEPACEQSPQKRHECAVKDESTPMLADGRTPKYRDAWVWVCTQGLLK